jgi:tRNA U34 5-carboxymethylaminomethyl modifying GTPase MnmE/TrmE
MIATSKVVLLGKLGHGKTYLLNKLTGEHFPSTCSNSSCTRQLQFGRMRQHGIVVIDTPGFFASDDVAAHIGAQKLALEGVQLSGIYIVVKFGRVDEVAEAVDKIMNFVGTEDVRIIVTHSDVASVESDYDPEDMKHQLSQRLDISSSNVMVVGKQTSSLSIELFIRATLHEPRDYEVNEQQVAANSNLCTCVRSFNKKINDVYAQIAAASQECEKLASGGKSFESDAAILVLQKATNDMVARSKEEIFREVDNRGLPEESQNVIYGKAGLAMSLKIKDFTDTSNKYLSWDVTDTCDPRNQYKKCNHCGAVFNKTEGCDGNTTCGAGK